MSSQLFGFNVNAAESNEAAVLDIVRRTKARSHTVMHGVALARKIYDAAGQATGETPIIACREDWPDDNWNDSRYSNMAAYFNQWKTRGGYWPDAHVYWLNESFVGRDLSKVRSLLAKSIEAMDASASTRVKALIGNYPDASLFEKDWLGAGEFDAWARVASQYTNGGYGYIGHHNYTYGLTWTGSAGVPYSQLLATNPQPPTRQAFQETHVWENWLQGRFLWPLLRCDHLNVPRYRFVCTEGVWDRMPSGEFEGWIPQTEAVWGLGKLRGPLDQRNLWSKLFPGVSPALSGVKQLEALANLMAGLPCYGVHLFTLSNNPQWTTFNFLNWLEFINELASYAQHAVWTPGRISVPTPIPTSPETYARVTGLPVDSSGAQTTFRNIRADALTTSADIGDLKLNDEVYYRTSTDAPNWLYVRQVRTGVVGWVAKATGFVLTTITTPTPVDCSALEAQIATLQQANTLLTAQVASLTEAKLAVESELLQANAALENFRSVVSGTLGTADDFHTKSGELNALAGHIYNTLSASLESVSAPPEP